jgi:hypothetical protein
MKEETQLQLKRIERILLEKHPNWTQTKAKWLARQAMGY